MIENRSKHLRPAASYSASAAMLVFFICYPFLVDAELSYLVYFFYTTFIYVTLAQGWNLMAGFTGQVSLGQHAFFGIGCYITAISWRAGVTGYLDPAAMIASGLGAAMLAALIGWPLLAKLKGDFFALGTLGLGEILRVAAVNGGSITEGAAGIGLPSNEYLSMAHYYYIALLFALAIVTVMWLLLRSRVGLALVAIRENEVAAAANGIAVLKYKVLVFAIGTFFTGLCGSLHTYYVFHVHTGGAFSLNWVIVPILMTLLGGAGTLWGPVIGAFILSAVFELANIWMPELHPILSGAFIILVVLFIPEGVLNRLAGNSGRGSTLPAFNRFFEAGSTGSYSVHPIVRRK